MRACVRLLPDVRDLNIPLPEVLGNSLPTILTQLENYIRHAKQPPSVDPIDKRVAAMYCNQPRLFMNFLLRTLATKIHE